jgi:hypothetical protein
VLVVLGLGLELMARATVEVDGRERLPRIGLGREADRLLEWHERHPPGAPPSRLRHDQHDPLLGWRPVPDDAWRSRKRGAYDVSVHTNEHGLRGRSPTRLAPAPGVPRVAVFGCSQTFGAGVEDDETWAALVGRALGVEVLNFGVHGFGTDQQLLYFERDGVRFTPDVVVLGFASYHLERNLQGFRFYAKPRFVLDGGELRLAGTPVPAPDALATMAPPAAPFPLLDRSLALRWAWRRLVWAQEQRLYDPEGEGWAVTRLLLERFERSAAAHGARLVIVNVDELEAEVEPPLEALARERGVTLVNVGPTFRWLRESGTWLRLPGDAHWGAAGHRVIASAVAEALRESGVLGWAQARAAGRPSVSAYGRAGGGSAAPRPAAPAPADPGSGRRAGERRRDPDRG